VQKQRRDPTRGRTRNARSNLHFFSLKIGTADVPHTPIYVSKCIHHQNTDKCVWKRRCFGNRRHSDSHINYKRRKRRKKNNAKLYQITWQTGHGVNCRRDNNKR